jgi:hypothetical protein
MRILFDYCVLCLNDGEQVRAVTEVEEIGQVCHSCATALSLIGVKELDIEDQGKERYAN